MKKLIMAVAIIGAAVAANAAAVSWKTPSKIYDNDGVQLKGANAVTAYVYMLANEAAYTSLSDVWGTYGEQALAGTADKSGATTAYVSSITIKSPNNSTANTDYYAAIITLYTKDEVTYYLAEKVSVTTGDDGNASPLFAQSVSTSAGATGAWTAVGGGSGDVPEPTSGLLVLLGVAGLALRRRRA